MKFVDLYLFYLLFIIYLCIEINYVLKLIDSIVFKRIYHEFLIDFTKIINTYKYQHFIDY